MDLTLPFSYTNILVDFIKCALANIVFFECDVSKHDQVQKIAKEIIAEVSVDR